MFSEKTDIPLIRVCSVCHFIRAQLSKTNEAVSWRIVKIWIIKYGIYANIFAEKMWVAFAFAKAQIFSAIIHVN